MVDERLREAERDAHQGGAAARGRLLQERVRAGAITADQLRLGAYLGHPAAGMATGFGACDGPLRKRVEGLGEWGVIACAVAAVSACRLAFLELQTWSPQDDELAAAELQVVRALGEWTKRPSEEQARAVHALGIAIPEPEGDRWGRTNPEEPSLPTRLLVRDAALEASRIPRAAEPGQAASNALVLASAVLTSLHWQRLNGELDGLDRIEQEASESIWAAAADGLLIWLDLERSR